MDMKSDKNLEGEGVAVRRQGAGALLKPCIDRLKRVQRKLFVMGNDIFYDPV